MNEQLHPNQKPPMLKHSIQELQLLNPTTGKTYHLESQTNERATKKKEANASKISREKFLVSN